MDYISINRARRLPQLKRDGQRLDLSTIYRWISRGINGVKLRVIRQGRVYVTTEADVNEFLQAINPSTPTESTKAEIKRAERRLKAAGIMD